jgi:hypothetical protein
MAISETSNIIKRLSYSEDISKQLILSGGTIIMIRDNVILATEVSEEQFRWLLDNPFIEKMDLLPLKRWRDEGIRYTDVESDENLKNL